MEHIRDIVNAIPKRERTTRRVAEESEKERASRRRVVCPAKCGRLVMKGQRCACGDASTVRPIKY